MGHITFFKYPINDVLDKLHLTSLKDCNKRYNESALIFIHYLNTIIYIRHTLSDNICAIKRELKKCKEDLLLLLFVNREFALSGDICFLNIVAAPNFLDTEKQFACESSFTPIIGESVLRTDDNFKHWWDNTFMSYIRKFGKSYGNAFTCLLRSTLTYMATLTFKVSTFLKDPRSTLTCMGTLTSEVPTLLRDPDHQIRTLLLSNEQFRAVNSSTNKKIVVGGFGSGKSVVAMYQLKVLVDHAKTDIKIFYICYDTKSMHIYTMKHFVECLNVNNVEIITENMEGLRKYLELDEIPPLSKLLDILVKRFSNQTIHLILDEFNCEKLDMSEAEELKKMYDTREELQYSTILLIAQSMEHQRTYTSYGKKIYHKSYNYNATGMQVIVLTKCLRNPRNIFHLNKSLQKELAEETNIVYHPTASQDGLRSEVKIDHTDHAKLSEFKHSNESNTTADYILLKNHVDHKESRDLKEEIGLEDIAPQLSTEICNTSITTDTDHAKLSEFKNGNESNTTADYISLKNHVDHKENIDKEQISLEDISPQISTEVCNKSITTETSYKFQSSEDVWHSIEGNRPLLLVFDKQSSKEEDCIAKLAISIENLCFQKHSQAVFIANNEKGTRIFQNILQCLNKSFFLYGSDSNWDIMDKDGKKYHTLPSEGNILTNYHGVRGIEASQVLVFIDPYDEFYWPYLVECCSRSTNILVLVTVDTLDPTATNIIYRSVNKLVKDNHIDIITICDETNTNRERPLRIHPDHPDIHRVNVNSNRFLKYIEEIPFKPVKSIGSSKRPIDIKSL